MNLSKIFFQFLKVTTAFSLLFELNVIENRTFAHIYQANSLKLKNGQIIVFLSDFHHFELVSKSAEMGMDPRRLQEFANQEGEQLYHFLDQAASAQPNLEVLLETENRESRSQSKKLFNLDTYLLASKSPEIEFPYDFFEFISNMTSLGIRNKVFIREKIVNLRGFDNRNESDRKFLDFYLESHFNPTSKILNKYHEHLRSHGLEWEREIKANIQTMIAELEAKFPDEPELFGKIHAKNSRLISHFSVSEWTRLSEQDFSERFHDLNSQILEVTNFKVDLSLFSEIIKSPRAFIIIHGGGAHLEATLDWMKSLSTVALLSPQLGMDKDDVIAHLRSGRSLDFENIIRTSLSRLSVCPICLTSAESLQKCGRCKATSYCGPTCQRKDWPKHKQKCVAPTKESTSSSLASKDQN